MEAECPNDVRFDSSSKKEVSEDKDGRLKRSVDLKTACAIIIGCIIGSGIFTAPIGILRSVKSVGASTVMWIVCGLYSMMGACCFAELGAMLPNAGGEYAYVYDAVCPCIGFLRLWAEIIVVRPASMAVVSIVFAEYIMKAISPECQRSEIALRCLAFLCLSLISFINSISVRLTTWVQNIFTFIKICALLMIIITGIVGVSRGRTMVFEDLFGDSDWSPQMIAKAFINGMFAFAGWQYIFDLCEEIIHVEFTLITSIVISCTTVTILYVLTSLAYVAIIPMSVLLDEVAVALVFAKIMYGNAWYIMAICVSCSTFGGINGTLMSSSRIFFAGSRNKQLPATLSLLHVDECTPIPAIIFTCIVATAYLFIDDIFVLITYLGVVQWGCVAGTVVLVIVFRWTRPNARRPVRVPLPIAFIYIFITIFMVIFIFIESPSESIMGVAMVFSGVVVYIISLICKRHKEVVRFMRKFTLVSQKTMRLQPSS